VLAAAAACIAGSGGAAQAQIFPTKPVTFIVPWPAGGTTDIAMRALDRRTRNWPAVPTLKEIGIVTSGEPSGLPLACASASPLSLTSMTSPAAF
jgi:hypothetical protein